MAADGYFIYNGREAVPPDVTRVRIDESLTVIPARAFDDNRNIEEVDCHVGVKTVGGWAFAFCPSLKRVIMPGVKVVEEYAFMNCEALRFVECDQLKIIGNYAFGGCISLRSINLPSAEIVKGFSFSKCTALTNVKFGNELESFGRAAFLRCTSLERITIPLKDGIITRDDVIFERCKKLKHVDLVEGGVLRDTIAALQLEEWKNDMKERIDAIDQILSHTPARSYDKNHDDVGGKARAIQMWISSVLGKIIDYKAHHRRLLKDAATTLHRALPNDIVNKNVLPFLELPSYMFEGED
eukprot:scaffold1772_cov93-Skeletonema_dohrnii-CCMP3373.AAC.2